MNSAEFKEVSKKAQPFMNAIRDFALGEDVTMENMVSNYWSSDYYVGLLIGPFYRARASMSQYNVSYRPP